MTTDYLPKISHTEDGSDRRVGIEIEFTGLELQEAAALIGSELNQKPQPVSDYELEIEDDDTDEPWRIERDQDLLKRLGRAREDADFEASLVDSTLESALNLGAKLVVPLELISPPLPMERMNDFQNIVKRLHDAGATGTSDSFLYAFGLQFNPEVPALNAKTVLRYLQAFACLQEWLFERSQLDLARQITRYTAPFPTSYVEQIIAENYAPSLEQLMDDYLAANPTRNRALDMLPLFAHLDEDRVRATIDDARIKSRPTFHYRLPNSEIGDPQWSIFVAWRDWLKIETLVTEPKKLDELKALCKKHLDKPLGGILPGLAEQTDKWLRQNL